MIQSESSRSESSSTQTAQVAWLSFATASLNILKRLDAEADIREAPPLVVFIPNGWGAASDDALMFQALISAHLSQFRELPEFAECVTRHIEEGIFKSPEPVDADGGPIGSDRDAQELFLLCTFLDPVNYTIQRNRRPEGLRPLVITDEQLLSCYEALRAEWTAPTVAWRTIVPLLNVTGKFKEMSVPGASLRLGPFSSQEKASVWKTASQTLAESLSIRAFALTDCRLMLSFEVKREDVTFPIDEKPYVGQAGRFITAMRLLKSGAVDTPAAFTSCVSVSPRLRFLTSTMPDFVVTPWGAEYELTDAELTSLVPIYDRLDTKNLSGLAVALRRFNQSYNRDNPDDALIDLAIVLESSLLAGVGQSKQQAAPLATRGAKLLAPQRNHQDTLSLLEAIYQARNKIVHEGLSLTDGRALVESKVPKLKQLTPGFDPVFLPDKAMEITRAILNAYLLRLEAGDTMSTINKSL